MPANKAYIKINIKNKINNYIYIFINNKIMGFAPCGKLGFYTGLSTDLSTKVHFCKRFAHFSSAHLQAGKRKNIPA